MQKMKELIGTLKSKLVKVIFSIKKMKSVITFVLKKLKMVKDLLAKILRVVINFLAKILKIVQIVLLITVKGVKDFLFKILKSVKDFLIKILKPLKGLFIKILKPVKYLLFKILKPVKGLLKKILEPVKDLLFKILKPVKDLLFKILKPVKGLFIKIPKFKLSSLKELKLVKSLSAKKRKILKVGAVFLLCLFLLTVCSNYIQTLLLPQVLVEEAEEGTIYKKVRGNGQLEGGKTYIVYADSDKQISELYVQVGDTVSQNQLLIHCKGIETEAMKEEAKALESMELEYQKKLLEESEEYGVDDLIIEDAKKKLEDAKDAETQAGKDEKALANLKTKITAKETELARLETAYKDSENKLGDKTISDTTALETEIIQSEKELETLENEKKDLNADLKAEKEKEKRDWDKITSLRNEISEIKTKITNKTDEITTAKKQLEQVKQANATTQQLINTNTTAKAAYEKCQKELSDLEEEKLELEAGYVDVEDTKSTVSQNEIALKELLLKEEQDKLDFEQFKLQLEEQRNEVEKLYQTISSNEIASPVSGVISEVHCSVSENVIKEQPLITIKQMGQGYLLKLQVDKKQAESVQIGDEAQILNVWDEEVTAYVSDIKASVEDPDKCKVIEFTVQGENLAIGQNIAVSVGEMQEYYDLIVPLNAIYEDNEGQFVFVLVEETTPFGSRYYVERYSVEVIASDDTHAAVISDFCVEDYVVTQTMEPLEDYGKVRLVD